MSQLAICSLHPCPGQLIVEQRLIMIESGLAEQGLSVDHFGRHTDLCLVTVIVDPQVLFTLPDGALCKLNPLPGDIFRLDSAVMADDLEVRIAVLRHLQALLEGERWRLYQCRRERESGDGEQGE